MSATYSQPGKYQPTFTSELFHTACLPPPHPVSVVVGDYTDKCITQGNTVSCTTVVVHNRDQAEIFQNTLIERTPKAAFRALDFISKTF